MLRMRFCSTRAVIALLLLAVLGPNAAWDARMLGRDTSDRGRAFRQGETGERTDLLQRDLRLADPVLTPRTKILGAT
jgi:hypothetical protein